MSQQINTNGSSTIPLFQNQDPAVVFDLSKPVDTSITYGNDTSASIASTVDTISKTVDPAVLDKAVAETDLSTTDYVKSALGNLPSDISWSSLGGKVDIDTLFKYGDSINSGVKQYGRDSGLDMSTLSGLIVGALELANLTKGISPTNVSITSLVVSLVGSINNPIGLRINNLLSDYPLVQSALALLPSALAASTNSTLLSSLNQGNVLSSLLGLTTLPKSTIGNILKLNSLLNKDKGQSVSSAYQYVDTFTISQRRTLPSVYERYDNVSLVTTTNANLSSAAIANINTNVHGVGYDSISIVMYEADHLGRDGVIAIINDVTTNNVAGATVYIPPKILAMLTANQAGGLTVLQAIADIQSSNGTSVPYIVTANAISPTDLALISTNVDTVGLAGYYNVLDDITDVPAVIALLDSKPVITQDTLLFMDNVDVLTADELTVITNVDTASTEGSVGNSTLTTLSNDITANFSLTDMSPILTASDNLLATGDLDSVLTIINTHGLHATKLLVEHIQGTITNARVLPFFTLQEITDNTTLFNTIGITRVVSLVSVLDSISVGAYDHENSSYYTDLLIGNTQASIDTLTNLIYQYGIDNLIAIVNDKVAGTFVITNLVLADGSTVTTSEMTAIDNIITTIGLQDTELLLSYYSSYSKYHSRISVVTHSPLLSIALSANPLTAQLTQYNDNRVNLQILGDIVNTNVDVALLDNLLNNKLGVILGRIAPSSIREPFLLAVTKVLVSKGMVDAVVQMVSDYGQSNISQWVISDIIDSILGNYTLESNPTLSGTTITQYGRELLDKLLIIYPAILTVGDDSTRISQFKSASRDANRVLIQQPDTLAYMVALNTM